VWHFTRIIGVDPAYGPRFADHKVSDEMIEERWTNGKSAANEMRQAEEEWLLGICREFGVSVRIRPLEKAYSYERSELASALAGLLKDIKLPPAVWSRVTWSWAGFLAAMAILNWYVAFHYSPDAPSEVRMETWVNFKVWGGIGLFMIFALAQGLMLARHIEEPQ